MREFRYYGERPKWDASLVFKVEELIDIAMGERGKNVVDFKMLQTILYILARHLRILEQMVEVRVHRGEKQAEEEGIISKEDKEKPKYKAKIEDKVAKSGKKGLTSSVEDISSNGYESSDEYDESEDGESEKSGARDGKNLEKHQEKESSGKDEERFRHDKEGRRESSTDRVTETDKHEREEKSRGRDIESVRGEKEGRREMSTDRVVESEKHDKEVKSRDKAEESVRREKERQKERNTDRLTDNEKHDKHKKSRGKDEESVGVEKEGQRESSAGSLTEIEKHYEEKTLAKDEGSVRGEKSKSKDGVEEIEKHDKEKKSREKDEETIRTVKEDKGEKGKVRDDDSTKYSVANKGRNKDEKIVKEGRGDKTRDKEEDSVRGGKSGFEYEEKTEKGKSIGKESISDKKETSRDKHKASLRKKKEHRGKDDDGKSKDSEEEDQWAKGKDKKDGRAKEGVAAAKLIEIQGRERGKDKTAHMMSDDEEKVIHEGAENRYDERKSKEEDRSGRNFKQSDSQGRLAKRASRSASGHQVGSIEVVTQEEFRLLENAVHELQAQGAPLPAPWMPDNKKLLADIATGNASLTDVIEAMKLQSRIQAAEAAIERMAQLIALLAASGVLPAEVLRTFTELEADVASMAEKSQAQGGMKDWEQTRKSLGLETLGVTSTMSDADADASAAMKRGLLGRVYAPSEAKEVTEVKEKLGPWSIMSQGGMSQGGMSQGVMSQRLMSQGAMSQGGVSLGLMSTTGTSIGRSVHSMRAIGGTGCVTGQEMYDALHALREDFLKNVGNITARANAAAETAVETAKRVAEELATALKLNDRVSALYSMVNDYTAQLHGFDSGIDSQMYSFQQQMNNMNSDLREGLHELHNITNNAETSAVLELTEQYELVATELENALHSHKRLLANKEQLVAEFKGLAECIEELREQKADRDEVIDGLRDKADLNRLGGLLTQEQFTKIHEELEIRMQMCYDKFRSQDAVWMNALKDFDEVISAKASTMSMRVMQHNLQEQLHQLNKKAISLTRVLGDPKAAVLTRRLTKGASCAACSQAAMMEVSELATMEPPRLPALRPRAAGADDVCYREVGPALPIILPYEDQTRRPHICKRWCGGSHTLLSHAVTRENAPPFQAGDTGPTRRYMGLGTDNKLYMLVDPCQPCEECNVVDKIPGEIEPSPLSGAGDQGEGPTIVTGEEARHVTIVDDTDIQLMRDELARKNRGFERRRSFGGRRPSDRSSPSEMDSLRDFEDTAPSKLSDIGVIVKGRITVLDDEAVRRASIRYETSHRSSLAEDRVQDQGAADIPH